MLWAIFAMLLVLGVVGFLASYTLVGGVMQILLISALVVLGINRIRAVSTQIRRSQVD
jgi:hypothetical protein